jgi:glycosyltransferase involved in cell wall biosynthesis
MPLINQGLCEFERSSSVCPPNSSRFNVMGLSVLIAAEHTSTRFGGEASLPLHYYRILRQRGIPTWLVVHERTRSELQALFPQDDRIVYVADTVWHRWLWRLEQLLPDRLAHFTVRFIMRLLTQLAQRQRIRQLVKTAGIAVIHQPIPVSPREPSMIFGMGVPVVIGPMNGGIDYPPSLHQRQHWLVNLLLPLGRRLASVMNWLIPGKRQAAILLVSNPRTRQALPQGLCQRVMQIPENGVDLALWQSAQTPIDRPHSGSKPTRLIFLGRLVHWKAVDLLLLAFKRIASRSVSLTIVGDGTERQGLEKTARSLDLWSAEIDQPGKVHFTGWMSPERSADQLKQSDILVLPSLMECGGAVVLEAMAASIPVIATDWGGPAEYIDSSCGILVDPVSREGFIENLAAAMNRLDQAPETRVAMGRAGRQKVKQYFDWDAKVDQMIEVYQQAIHEMSSSGTQAFRRTEVMQSSFPKH